jgi:hypothetical protein
MLEHWNDKLGGLVKSGAQMNDIPLPITRRGLEVIGLDRKRT